MAAQKGLVKKKEVKNSSQESPFQPQNDLAVQLMDNRPEAIQLQQIQESADNGILNDEIAQLQATADASSTSTAPFQFKENKKSKNLFMTGNIINYFKIGFNYNFFIKKTLNFFSSILCKLVSSIL